MSNIIISPQSGIIEFNTGVASGSSFFPSDAPIRLEGTGVGTIYADSGIFASGMTIGGSTVLTGSSNLGTAAFQDIGTSDGDVVAISGSVSDNQFLRVQGSRVGAVPASTIAFQINPHFPLDTVQFGIGNNNAVKINTSDVADNDYAKFTSAGLEGRSASEVRSDLSLGSLALLSSIDADSVTVSNLEVDNIKASTLVVESDGIGSNDNDTTIPTSAAVKAYADSIAGGGSVGTLQQVTTLGSTTSINMEIQGAGTKSLTVDSTDGHASVIIDRHSSSYDANLMFQTNGATYWRLWNDSNDTTLSIRDEANASNVMTWEVGGNIGIGLDDPTQKLEVAGDIFINGGPAGGRSLQLKRSGASKTWKLVQGHTATDYLEILEDADTRFLIKNGGKIGIGATNPTKELVVSGTISGVSGLFGSNGGRVGIGSSEPLGRLDVAANTDQNIFLGRAWLGSHESDHLYLSHYDNGSSTNYALKQSPAGSTAINAKAGQNVSMSVNNSDIVFVKGSNSNVGLGTNDPQKAAHLYFDGNDGLRIQSTNNHAFTQIMAHDSYSAYIQFRDGSNRYWLESNASDELVFRPNATSTDANKILFDDKGSVGIGTTNPAYKLDVISSTGGSLARFKDSDSSHAGLLIQGDTNGGSITNASAFSSEVIYLQNSANAMRFYTDGTEAVRIDSSQRVGIGTNSVNGFTHINGRMTVESPAVPSTLAISDSGDATKCLRMGFDTGWDAGSIQASDFGAGWKNIVMASYGGNVGIGTTSVPQKLTVKGGITATSSSNIQLVTMTNSSDHGRLIVNQSAGVTRVLLDSNGDSYFNGGNLGIGLTNPSYKLEVDGGDFLVNTANGGYVQVDESDNSLKLSDNIKLKLGTSNDIQIYSDNSNLYYANHNFNVYFRSLTNDKDIIFETRTSDSQVEIMRFDGSSSRVGIGSATPAYKLDVAGSIQAKDAGFLAGVGGDADGFIFHDLYTAGGNYWGYKALSSPNRLAIVANASESMSFESNGRVGIGSSDPASRLDINNGAGGSSETLLNVGGTGNGRMLVRHIDGKSATSASAQALYLNYVSNSIVSIAYGGGNVGIGTHNPQTKLDLWGSMRLDSAGNTDRSLYFRNQATVAKVRSDAALQFDVGVGASPSIAMYIEEDTRNVGIGTSTMHTGARLTVQANNENVIATGLVINSYQSTAATAGNGVGIVMGQSNGVYSSKIANVWTNNNPSYLQTNIAFYTMHDSYLAGSETEKMRLTSKGYLGIGTGSPRGMLDVVGNTDDDTDFLTIHDIDPSAGSHRPSIRFRSDSAQIGQIVALDNGMRFSVGTSETSHLEIRESTKHVGVGTGDPSYRLTVNAGNTNEIARFHSEDNDALISISDNTSTGYIGLDASLDLMSLGFNSSMGVSSNVNITTGGFVGIGTNSPGAALDIHTATNTNGILIREDTDNSITHNMYVSSSDNGVMVMYANGQSSKIQLNTAGDSYFNGGDVGIGTSNPSQKLNVSGGHILIDNQDPQLQFNDTDGSTYSSSWMYQNNAIKFVWGGGHKFKVDSAGGITLGQSYSTSETAPSKGIITEGKVGLGTTSPSATLHVADTTSETDGKVIISGTGTATLSADVYIYGSGNSDVINAVRARNDASIKVTSQTAGAYFRTNSATSTYNGIDLNQNWFIGQYGHTDLRIVDGTASAGDAAAAVTIKDSTKFVGLGTTNPVTRLHVIGDGGDAMQIDDGYLRLRTTSNNDALQIQASVGNEARILAADLDTSSAHPLKIAADQIRFTTSGSSPNTEVMRITAEGKVGIGSNTPAAFLDVSRDNNNVGNQLVVADTEGASAAIRTYTTSSPAGLILNHYYAEAGSSNEYARYADFVSNVGNGAGTKMRFITKNAANTYFTGLLIDNSGNIGIGTDDPTTARLRIKGTTNDSSALALQCIDSTDTQTFFVRNDGVVQVTDNYFYVSSNAGAYVQHDLRVRGSLSNDGGALVVGGDVNFDVNTLFVDSTNNRVGIGTNSPTGKLHIYNTASGSDGDGTATMNATGQDSIVLYGHGGVNTATYGSISWLAGDTNRRRAMITAVAENADTDFVGLAFYTQGTDGAGDFSESMRITRDGDLGLGTTSVNAGIGLQVANGSLYVTNGVANVNHIEAQYFGNGQELKLSAGQSADLKLMHYNTVDVTVKSDGKVGIGTITPSGVLDVGGDGATILLHSNDYKIASIHNRGTSTNYDRGGFSLYNQTVEALRLDSFGDSYFNGGNVGIGTNSCDKQVHISATEPYLRLEESDSGGNKRLDLFVSSSTGVIAANQSAQTMMFQTVGKNRMTITAAGNVGIGATNATSPFHLRTTAVSRADSTAVTAITKGIATSTIGAKLSFTGVNNSNNNLIGGLSMGNDGEEYAGMYAVDGGASATTHLAFFAGTAAGTNERIRILADGKVGIGTTNPDNRLHVETSDDELAKFESTDTKGYIEIKDNNYSSYVGINSDVGAASFGGKTDGAADTGNLNISTINGKVGIGTTAFSEQLGVKPDTDVSAEIGKAHVGYIGFADYAGFSHVDKNSTTDYALLQSAGGSTFLNKANGYEIYFRNNNSTIGGFNTANDFYVNTDNLYVDISTDRVGINNSSPAEALDVVGLLKLGHTRDDDTQKIARILVPEYDNSHGQFLCFMGTANVDSNFVSYGGGTSAADAATALAFYTAAAVNTAVGTERMRIDSDGNMSIGAGSNNHAGTRVHIQGPDTSPSMSSTAIDDCTMVLGNSDVNYGIVFATAGDGDGLIQSRRLASAVYYNTCISPYGGNVGIGTDAPGYKLEVNGSIVGTSKSFLIDHPTQTGKKLMHACIEGPENGVYFRGRSQETGIQAPEYWSGLVDIDSMTVDVTPIGPNQSIYVDRIDDNGDICVGSNTNESLNYFYVVYGERKDIDKLEVVKDAPPPKTGIA